MKVLYATDLHGHKWKYKKIVSNITDHDILILGADILPKFGDDIFGQQEKFIKDFLPKFFESIDIPVILDFGNDDYECFHDIFKELTERYTHIYYSHLREISINGVSFLGMHYVPDYPFRLKDWVRREHTSEFPTKSMCSFQYGSGLMSDKHPRCGPSQMYCLRNINDLDIYLGTKASIECCLKALPEPRNEKAVYLIHSPPKMCGLDRTGSRLNVGSKAVTEFILDRQPMLCLHGHIHESPFHTDISINKLGSTICIQPGQIGGFNDVAWCEFDLDYIEATYTHKAWVKGAESIRNT